VKEKEKSLIASDGAVGGCREGRCERGRLRGADRWRAIVVSILTAIRSIQWPFHV
jgi:hypothetical protein